jgi:hypothetical protein
VRERKGEGERGRGRGRGREGVEEREKRGRGREAAGFSMGGMIAQSVHTNPTEGSSGRQS